MSEYRAGATFKNYPSFYSIPTDANKFSEFSNSLHAFLVRAESDDTLPNLWALYLWNALVEIQKLRELVDEAK